MPRLMFPRRSHLRCSFLFALAALGPLGCHSNSVSDESEPPAADTRIVLTSPEAATQSLLRLLSEQLEDIAGGGRRAGDAARNQVFWHVAAREELVARHERSPGASGRDSARMVRNAVDSWASMIAYYAKGLELEQASVEPNASPMRAVVRVPARGPDGEVVLRVRCCQGADHLWRVYSLDFAGPQSSQPAATSQKAQPAPASQSSPTSVPASVPTAAPSQLP